MRPAVAASFERCATYPNPGSARRMAPQLLNSAQEKTTVRPIKFLWIIGTATLLTVVSGSAAVAQIIVAGGYPYGYRYAARDASVRFDVKPNEASVYVDGYYAGIVDDFD